MSVTDLIHEGLDVVLARCNYHRPRRYGPRPPRAGRNAEASARVPVPPDFFFVQIAFKVAYLAGQ